MIYSILLGIILFTNSEAFKICTNCKYFLPDTDNDIFGKCSFYPRVETNFNNFLVTGIKEETSTSYYYCSTVRSNEDMCGKHGKNYKRKYIRKRIL
jgi:hypothetical protein